MPTPTVENYVKALYVERQRCGGDLVGLGKLATVMGVVPGTVTTMVRTLSDAGLVRYEPRVGVALTPEGETLALHVLRRHRLVEAFLVEVLKFDWAEVHDEAEELEHAISDKLLEKIDVYLGRPTVDPHGDPIPSANGEISRPTQLPLTACAPGQRVRLTRVDNQDAAFLNYITEKGLRPGTELTVLTADEIAGAITLQKADGTTVALGQTAAGVMYVTLL
ncbi:MAG: metal-dependent transcriptional regulator [Tepidisphaeraceae bacterium]